jgi:hypothetical protein
VRDLAALAAKLEKLLIEHASNHRPYPSARQDRPSVPGSENPLTARQTEPGFIPLGSRACCPAPAGT